MVDQTVGQGKGRKNTGVEVILQHLVSAPTPPAFAVFTMVVTGFPLVMALLFATTTLVRPLLSISFPVPIFAVAALSFPALFLSPTSMLPVSASAPARPLGLLVFPMPVPVVFMPSFISLSLALLIPGPLSLGASVFVVVPILLSVPVIPSISFFLPAFGPSVPAATATSFALSSLLVSVCATGSPSFPVCATGSPPFPVPSVPVSISALPLLPLPVPLSLQLAVKAGAVVILLVVVASAPRSFGRPSGARRPSGWSSNSNTLYLAEQKKNIT